MSYSIKTRVNIVLFLLMGVFLGSAAVLTYLFGEIDISIDEMQTRIDDLSSEYNKSLDGLRHWESMYKMNSLLQKVQLLEERYLRTGDPKYLEDILQNVLVIKKWNTERVNDERDVEHGANHRHLQVELTEYADLIVFIINNPGCVIEDDEKPEPGVPVIRISELQNQAAVLWGRVNICEKIVRDNTKEIRDRIFVVQNGVADMQVRITANKGHLQHIMWGLVAFFAAAVISAGFFVQRTMLRPILSLTDFAGKVGEGEYGLVCDPPNSMEFGRLARTINKMSCRIKDDIAARKENEKTLQARAKALQESEEQLNIIFENIPVGMMMVNSNREIVKFNKSAQQIACSKGEDVIGKICHDIVCSAERGRCPIYDLGEEINLSERTVRCSDGSEVPILKSVVPLEIRGETMLLEAFIDISDRIRAAQLVKDAKDRAEAASTELAAKVDELERFNKLAVNREMQMIELKKAVNELSKKCGEPTPFDLTHVGD